MSLDFNLGKIENYLEVCWIPVEEAGETPRIFLDLDSEGTHFLNPITHNIIWRCMPVGIGVVSERTLPEFWARNVVWLALNEYKQDFTLDDLRRHIGLSTNVFPEETRAQWRKRIIDRHLEQLRTNAQRKLEADKQAFKELL